MGFTEFAIKINRKKKIQLQRYIKLLVERKIHTKNYRGKGKEKMRDHKDDIRDSGQCWNF